MQNLKSSNAKRRKLLYYLYYTPLVYFFPSIISRLRLKNILNKDIPTVFVLAYYSCPKMCSFILDGVKDVVQASNKRPGIDYNLVTLSFNSKDSFESSKIFENKYSSILNADESWNFYTSDDISIEKITKSVGFKFQPDGDEFAHPAGIILLTNDGIVSDKNLIAEFLSGFSSAIPHNLST